MKRHVFALEGEPESNHVLPKPLWGPARSSRRGAREKLDNRTREKFEKERAERLSKDAQAALKGHVGADCRGGDAAPGDHRHDDPRFRQRLADGMLVQGLSENNARGDQGARGNPGEFNRSVFIRGKLERSSVGHKIPRRGAVSAPARIDVQWELPHRQFPKEGLNLLDRFLKLEAMERGLERGLSVAMAGLLVLGLEKSGAHKIATELEKAGGAHLWLVGKALPLIQRGKIPRGRDASPDCIATAFYLSLLGAPARIGVWLERIGYRVVLDQRRLDESLRDFAPHEREAIEYCIQSRYLWELYP